MKIAIFSDNFYPEISGIADSILEAGKELAKRGHTVRYYVPEYSRRNFKAAHREYQEPDFGENISVKRVRSLPFPYSPTTQSRFVSPSGSQLMDLRLFRPDIIHTHTPFGVGMEALIAANIFRVPLIGTNHTSILDFTRYVFIKGQWVDTLATKFIIWYYNKCTFVTTPSPSALEEMKKTGLRKPSEVISNPIDANLYFPAASDAEREELKKHFNLTKTTIVYAGRLAPEKNIVLLINALSDLVKKNPNLNTELAIAGHGIDSENLKKLVTEKKLDKYVHFLGMLSHHELAKLYRAGDIFVIPSFSEVQSMTMLQALSSGLPVIAAKSKGTEYLQDSFGFVVSATHSDELTNKLELLLGDKSLRERMGKAAHAFSNQFHLQSVAVLWEEKYKKLLK